MDMYNILNKLNSIGKKQEPLNESAVAERATGDYSAKKAAAGKDIGKPGKAFSKIAKSAGERYGSKETGEKVAGAVLAKLRAKESAEPVEEGAFEEALEMVTGPGGKKVPKFAADGKGKNDLMKRRMAKEEEVGEGNDFTGARLAAIRAGKPTFKVDGKVYKVTGDTSDERSQVDEREYSDKEDFDAKAKRGDTFRGTKGTHIKTDKGVRHERHPEKEEDNDDDIGDEPKKKGRKVVGTGKGKKLGAKSRGTSKLASQGAIKEFADDEISLLDKGEYDREGDMAKDDLQSIAMAAKELHSILGDDQNLPEWVQSKITKALDYINSSNQYMHQQEFDEVAPPGAKAERMVKGIKKSLSKDGKLSGKDKAIAYATTWKAHKQGKVEEESNVERDDKAERAGKKVAKDIEYDEKKKDGIHGNRRGAEDSKAERAGKKVAKDIEHDEKVDETTTAGSVATAPAQAKSGGKFSFGQGVYEGKLAESFNTKLKTVLNEGMSVNISVDENGTKSMTVNATDDDAMKLAQILKLAGMEQSHGYEEACPACGSTKCGCEGMAEGEYANSPEVQTADTDTMVNTLSGGLNGKKTTGQTTIPVVASQVDRLSSQVQETRLWDLYKNYENK
jgi:hypothetical protein